MLRALERSVDSVDRDFVLIPPPHVRLSRSFENVTIDPDERHRLIQEMQYLRGRIYLEDGAIQPHHLTPDGLHETPEDAASWHLLFLDSERRVSACIWYLEYDEAVTFNRLRLRQTPVAKSQGWRERLISAVASDLALAHRQDLKFAEVGGWAVSKENRCSSEGLLLALAGYSLGNLLGGALGITTATVRHSSSSILKRLGGTHLQSDGVAIPPYYDARYGCEMEILRFDSRKPNERYAGLVAQLARKLVEVPIVSAPNVFEPVGEPAASWFVNERPSFATAAFVPALA